MYVRDINELPEVTKEIMYIDEITMEDRVGIVMYIDRVDANTAFAYVASTRKEENDKWEGSINYRDIIVFDNKPVSIDGWHRDPIRGEFDKYIDISIYNRSKV